MGCSREQKFGVAQITDLSLPVALCEPVTDMQRRGDFLEYTELLHEVTDQGLSAPPSAPSTLHPLAECFLATRQS